MSQQNSGERRTGHQNIGEMFLARVAESGVRAAMRQREGDTWRDVSWRDWGERSHKVAAALIAMGAEAGDRIAILSNSCDKWAITDVGVLLAGCVVVPIYQSNMADECAYILNDSQSRAVFCEDPSQVDKILSMKSELPYLKKIIYYEAQVDLDRPDAKGRRRLKIQDVVGDAAAMVSSWSDFLGTGQDTNAVGERTRASKPDHLATLVYTSGTTGKPKGVMLTHGNIIFECETVRDIVKITAEDEQFLFLPMAHIFARMLMFASISRGCCSAIDSNVTRVVQNCQEIKPTFMGAVPRVYEKAFVKIKSAPEKAGGVKLKLFQWAMDIGRQVSALKQRGEKPSGGLALQARLADKLVFSKIKNTFGGRIRFFVSGGAPLAREIAEFLHAADILVLEGYGLTETSAATHINRPNEYKFGSVGKPIPGVEVKIEQDGEILVSGPNVLQGYFNKPEETAAALEKDSTGKIWFHTGDIGEIDPQNYLRITDRKKDLFKTSGGKYIAPQHVENTWKAASIYLSQVMVYGENQNYVTALVTLNEENILAWAKDNNIPGSLAELATSAKVKELLQRDLDTVNAKLPPYETVKKFAIVYPDFAIESGELTPTLKVKRKAVTEKHKSLLESFYNDRNERVSV
jgi:long-chain acyl-CoA synthetase